MNKQTNKRNKHPSSLAISTFFEPLSDLALVFASIFVLLYEYSGDGLQRAGGLEGGGGPADPPVGVPGGLPGGHPPYARGLGYRLHRPGARTTITSLPSSGQQKVEEDNEALLFPGAFMCVLIGKNSSGF